MKNDLTQNAKSTQKKIYDPQVNELKRQVSLDWERLMSGASGPEIPRSDRNLIRTEEDGIRALGLFENAAAQGDAEAQYSVGYIYEGFEGLERDDAKAAEWYGKAAAQGHAKAQNNLAFLYRKGYGIPKDIAKAVELYKKAGRQGCTIAQTNLGYMYKYGTEIGQDYGKAAEWFRKAAEQGNPTGQVNLAKLYDEGKGVPRDYAEAAKWYLKAAEQGIKPAAARLGEMYEKGEGVPQDYTKAAYWAKKGVIMRCWAFNMGTMSRRHDRWKKLNKVIARVSEPELKSSLIKTRDEYWDRIQRLNKPNYTDEDKEQIQLEHERIDKILSKWEKYL